MFFNSYAVNKSSTVLQVLLDLPEKEVLMVKLGLQDHQENKAQEDSRVNEEHLEQRMNVVNRDQ